MSYGPEPSHQCLRYNEDVTLACTVNPLTTVVEWLRDKTLMATCSNHANMCIPAAGSTIDQRLNFSSEVSKREFTLRINPVAPGTDAGTYSCEHGVDSASMTIAACGRLSL